MLRSRLAIGIPMTAVFVLILAVDTAYFAPWFPLWLGAMVVVMGLAAREVAGLLDGTEVGRPRGWSSAASWRSWHRTGRRTSWRCGSAAGRWPGAPSSRWPGRSGLSRRW